MGRKSDIKDFIKEDDEAFITRESGDKFYAQWALFFAKEHADLVRRDR